MPSFNNGALQAKSKDEFCDIAYREYVTQQLQPLVKNKDQLKELVDYVIHEAEKVRKDKMDQSSP